MRSQTTWKKALTALCLTAVPVTAFGQAAKQQATAYELSAAQTKIDGAVRSARRGSTQAAAALRNAAGSYNISVKFAHELTSEEIAMYESAGVQFRRLPSGRIAGAAGIYAAWASDTALDALAADASVESIEAGRPVQVHAPLDLSREEIQADVRHATRTWSNMDGNRGRGQTIGVVDTGIDIFHPDFFAVKSVAPYNWIDVDGNGGFTPGFDAVDLNRNGVAEQNEKLNYVERLADADASFNVYDCDTDWLYNDADHNGNRDFGPAAGFTESDDCYGERLFYVADADGNDRLSPGEKLYTLGKSKVRKVLFGDHEYVRGVDLINTPIDQNGHGTSTCSILVAQAAGFNRRFCGIAPDAELVVVDRYSFDAETAQEQSDNYVAHLIWIEDQNARVMLWEMGGWTSQFMDGSSHLESLITNRQLIGYSVQVVPNGNLGGKGRHAQADVLPGERGSRTFSIPANVSPTTIWATVLTHANSGSTSMLVEIKNGDDGYVLLNQGSNQVSGHIVNADYSVSNRGTYRFDMTILKQDGSAVSSEDWSVRVRNFGSNLETYHFYVTDDVSTWGGGAYWTQDVDASTVAWPATADVCIGAASYSTVSGDYTGDVPGVLSPFSGRGPRVDGEFVQAVAAPGDYGDVMCAQSQAINVAGAWAGVRGFGGTSAAGPHVAASAALLFEALPGVGAMDVRDALLASAATDGFTGATPNDDWGWGKLRVDDAYYTLVTDRCEVIPSAANIGDPGDGDSGFDPDQALTLRWSDDAEADLYDLHFGTSNPPARYVPGLVNAEMTIVPSQLQPNTTYYWQVVSRNACGYVVKSDVWSLTTGAQYIPQPDIEVYQQVLVNNQFIRTQVPTGGEYDYPEVVIGDQAGIIFAIYNEGDADLALTGTPKVLLTGPGVADYYVNYTPVEDSVAPGNWAPVAITFKPVLEGTRIVTVRIYTNDPDEAQYSFTLFGTGLPADDGDPNDGGVQDDDGDGVPNVQDQCPGQDDTLDSDFDGTPDCLDLCPNDPAKIDAGACGCGVADEDVDNDGVFDCDDDEIGGPNEPNEPNEPNVDDPNQPTVGEPNEPVDVDPTDPNEPTDVEPVEPNEPTNFEPVEPNEPGDIEPNDPNGSSDLAGDDLDDIIEPIAPGGLCGFGAGFAMMMGFFGFGGRLAIRRRRS